jgi:hypothetical protein
MCMPDGWGGACKYSRAANNGRCLFMVTSGDTSVDIVPHW